MSTSGSKKLTDTNISDTYQGVLHARGKALSLDGNAVERVYDGTGTRSSLSIGTGSIEVDGSANFKGSTPGAGVKISANDGSIEIADNAGSDNPYIDFKTHLSSEDYDCRIIKVDNGLEFITGGSGSTSSNLEIYSNGRTRIGSGNRAPISTLSITNGGIAITSNGDSDWGFIDQGPSNTGIGFRGQGSSTTSDLDLFVSHGGNVGIGTMAPQKRLHLDGSLRLKVNGAANGKVLTCINTSGDCEWRDISLTSVVHFANVYGSAGRTSVNSNPGSNHINAAKSLLGSGVQNGDYVFMLARHYYSYRWGNGTAYADQARTYVYRVFGAPGTNQTYQLQWSFV